MPSTPLPAFNFAPVPAGTAAEFHVPFRGEAEVAGPAEARVLRTEEGKEVRGLRPGRWTLRMKK